MGKTTVRLPTFKYLGASILEREHTNVTCVGTALVAGRIFMLIREFTGERDLQV